jgi:hypothetical protein
MSGSKNQKAIPSQKPNSKRHTSHCSICAHPDCEEIEREFISWKNAANIVTEYKLRDRSALYRHAHAVDLFSRRDRNVRAALGRIIEKVDDVRVTAGAVVQAIALHTRINARGELVERNEQVGINDLFEKMNHDEKESYAKDGTLPSWFPRLTGAKGPQGSGGDENE